MPASDEELLIQEARRKRGFRRSGRALIVTLAAAAAFGVIGWLLLFRVRPVIKAVPFLPTGSLLTALLVAGIGAFAIAAVLIAWAWLGASPGKPWGKPFSGTCPRCGGSQLREDAVEYDRRDGAHLKIGPKGLVILCETRGCDYATALVTTPTRA